MCLNLTKFWSNIHNKTEVYIYSDNLLQRFLKSITIECTDIGILLSSHSCELVLKRGVGICLGVSLKGGIRIRIGILNLYP